ncbi:MAG TPA: Hsp70 family protein [Bryobacteraceae bacterium]
MSPYGIGFDFGTTNSSIAIANPDRKGETRLASFPFAGAVTESFRSVLYLEQLKEAGRTVLKSWTGPEAIEHYLESDQKGRLVQSLKSFLSSRTLAATEVFGRRVPLEELISVMLRDLRHAAEVQFEVPVRRAVIGRPVRFVGAENEADNEYAVSRLTSALSKAGFEEVVFELEPAGAACYYESTLDHEELILIGDFGGGTSDFSVLRAGPREGATRRDRKESILANDGVGLAGDAFDARIVRNVVSPVLGAGTMMRSGMDKTLPVPNWVYLKLERWHHLSFLKSKETLDMLETVKRQAFEPSGIEGLLHLIRGDLGYHLHRSVQKAKADLSQHEMTILNYDDGLVEIHEPVRRGDFERWIEPELSEVERAVDRVLAAACVDRREIDMVFLTGGTSFVPAVRRIFESRFGRERIRAGNEFTSVARGLALYGLELADI